MNGFVAEGFRVTKRACGPCASRAQDGQRSATVRPVFGKLRDKKGLDHFTLRGRTKVDAQWKLY
jgi:hypothetical protein